MKGIYNGYHLLLTLEIVVYDPILKGIYNERIPKSKKSLVVYDPILKVIYNGSGIADGGALMHYRIIKAQK